MPEIFLLKGKETFGPFDESRIRQMLSQGLLSPEEKCLPVGEDTPRALSEILSLSGGGGGSLKGEAFAAVGRNEHFDEAERGLPLMGELAPHFEPAQRAHHAETGDEGERQNRPPSKALLYHGGPAFISFPRVLLVGLLLLIAGLYFSSESSWFLLAGLVGFAIPYCYVLVVRACHVYVVTPVRVEIVYGVFSKSSREVKIEDIRAINVKKQGLIGMIGVGDVEFGSAGSEGVEVVFSNIWKPHRVKNLVRELQDTRTGGPLSASPVR